jgi:hypothetical protein
MKFKIDVLKSSKSIDEQMQNGNICYAKALLCCHSDIHKIIHICMKNKK